MLAFAGTVVPILRYSARRRIAELKREFGFCDQPIPTEVTTHVSSANADEIILLLKSLAPSVVVFNGTRIIANACSNTSLIIFTAHIAIFLVEGALAVRSP